MGKQKKLPTLSEYCSQFCGNEEKAKFTYEQGYTAAENLLGRKIREQAVEIDQLHKALNRQMGHCKRHKTFFDDEPCWQCINEQQEELGKTGDQECVKCEFLMELYERTPKSNRNYWLATELFVFLHDGNDVCDKRHFNFRRFYQLHKT